MQDETSRGERKSMAVINALTLVLIGALIHGCSALKCYQCHASKLGDKCDDPFDKDDATEQTCPSMYNACIKGKGKSDRMQTHTSIRAVASIPQIWSQNQVQLPSPHFCPQVPSLSGSNLSFHFRNQVSQPLLLWAFFPFLGRKFR